MALSLTLRARPGFDLVYIGDEIAVQLVSTRDGRVKLRFTAPAGMVIDRACVRAERQAEIARLLDDGGKCIENP